MRKFVALCALLGTLCSLTACADTSTTSDNTTSDTTSSTTEQLVTATPEIGDADELAEHYEILRNAKLGDKIEFNDYLYSIADGCKTYYIHGRYVITSENVVMQTRDELEVPDVGTPIGEIIALDENFDITKATVTFYGADGSAVSGTLDQTLTATVTDCVVEYADWLNEDETYGAVQSYLFTYGYVPVKICGYYDSSDKNATTDEDTAGTDTTTSTAEAETTSDTESTTE